MLRLLDACDFATRTNAELIGLGVPAHTVSYERLRRTGHGRRIAARWSPTVGSWGGCKTLREIADDLEVPLARAHSWAMYRRLKTRTKTYARSQAQLSVMALATPGSAREVARLMGVLPIEAVIYRAAAEALRVELGVPLVDILRWSPERLEDAWSSLELVVEHTPARTRVNLSDPNELAAVVAEAKRAASFASEVDSIIALVRRELPHDDGDDEHTRNAAPDMHSAEGRIELAATRTDSLSPAPLHDLDSIVAEQRQPCSLTRSSDIVR